MNHPSLTIKAFAYIYGSVLKRGKVLICEKDDSYFPPMYKISICEPEIENEKVGTIVLWNNAEDIKKYVIKTYHLQAGSTPFIAYERDDSFGTLQFGGTTGSYPSLKRGNSTYGISIRKP